VSAVEGAVGASVTPCSIIESYTSELVIPSSVAEADSSAPVGPHPTRHVPFPQLRHLNLAHNKVCCHSLFFVIFFSCLIRDGCQQRCCHADACHCSFAVLVLLFCHVSVPNNMMFVITKPIFVYTGALVSEQAHHATQCPWSCSFAWCLAEGCRLDSAIDAVLWVNWLARTLIVPHWYPACYRRM